MGIFDAFTNAGDPSQGGLMGMFANPQTAGLLGMAGGLLQAAGPSRIPVTMGQALGAGVQGMGQGVGNAFQTQQQLLRMRAMQGLMGGDPGQSGAPQAGPSYSAMFGPSSAAPGSMAPASDVGGASGGDSASGAPTGGPSIYGRSPQQLFNQGMLMNMAGIQGGGDLMRVAVEHDPTILAQAPTDLTKMGIQGGMSQADIQAANRAGVAKANYIAPTALRTPIYFDPTSGTTKVVPADQLAAGYGAQYGAEARAKGQYQPMQVWDPTANGGQGGFVFQTTTNVSDAANGTSAPSSVPIGIRNNNFGNIKGSNGQFATYDTPQEGVNAADQLLSTYGSKHGINTIAGIANRWAPAGDGSNNPAQKAAAMAAASGVGVNQPINLADPSTRARILPALFDTETPGWRNAISGGQAPTKNPSGPMAAAPPLGMQAAVQNTATDNAGNYNNLSQFAGSSPDRVNTLDNMMALAQGTTKFGPGWDGRLERMSQINSYLPSGMAFGGDAASNAQTFQKYASYLVQQYQRAMGGKQTDAQLNTVIHGTPNPEMLNQTMIEVIPKLKAMELAVQAKATAADNWMAQHQNNASNYNQFESAWRQNYDPRIYQMQQMTPDQRAAFMKSQPDASALRSKVGTALQNGWVQ
jgi:hypothetical protein